MLTTRTASFSSEVANWNTPLLEGRILNLLASLKCRGNLTVSFPVAHVTLVVTPGSEGSVVKKLFSMVFEAQKKGTALFAPFGNMRACQPHRWRLLWKAGRPSQSVRDTERGGVVECMERYLGRGHLGEEEGLGP
jgi:hypothetical protein